MVDLRPRFDRDVHRMFRAGAAWSGWEEQLTAYEKQLALRQTLAAFRTCSFIAPLDTVRAMAHMIFKLTQSIDRPVEEVFDTVIHLENFPQWSPQNPSARRLNDGQIGEGSRFEMQIKGFGLVPQTLEEFDRNRRVRVVPHIKQIEGGHRFLFTDLGGKTRIDHELEMTPRGFYRLMSPLMYLMGRRNLKLTVAALKTYLERRN